MKAIVVLFFIAAFSTVSIANPTVVRVNKNSPYQMVVNYQVCFVEFAANKRQLADCYPKIRNFTLKKEQAFRDITMDNSALFIRIISAYTFDGTHFQKGHGEYGPEDCKVFNTSPITLISDSHNDQIICSH